MKHDLEDIRAARFAELPIRCDNAEPGIDEVDDWRDWTALETTPDQLRIEDYLLHSKLSGRSLLHVGVGNSSLAERLAPRTGRIVGTTIARNEATRGASLGIRNYNVEMHNKYSGRPLQHAGQFDFIVDNNPTTFCCCIHHLMTMMDFYEQSLTRDGQILTDRAGLGWVVSTPGANQRWKFSFDDLAFVASKVGLRAFAMDENVVSLARQTPPHIKTTGLLASARSVAHRVRRRLAKLLPAGS